MSAVMCSYCYSLLTRLVTVDAWVSTYDGRLACDRSPEVLGGHWPLYEDVDERCRSLLTTLLATL